MAVTAETVTVELLAKTDQFASKMSSARQQFVSDTKAIEGAASSASSSVARSHDRIGESAGNAGAAQAILQATIRKTTDQFAAGAPLATIFAEHIESLAQAGELAGGKLGAVGSLLAGPWGIALSAAASVAAILAQKLLEDGDAAVKADKGLEQFQNRQLDLANFIDATTGKLIRQNAILLQNAKLQNVGAINKDTTDIAGLRDQGFAAVRAASVTGETFTAERQPGAKTYDPGLVQALDSSGKSIVALYQNVAKLNRPDLAPLTRQLSDLASRALLAGEHSKTLAGQVQDLDTAERGGTVRTAALVDQQVAYTNATSEREKAELRLQEVRKRGAAIDADKSLTGDDRAKALDQYQRDLDAATKAVNAATQAEKDARAARKEHSSEMRDEAKAARELQQSYAELTRQYDPGRAAADKYADAIKKIDEQTAAGNFNASQRAQALIAANEQYVVSLEKVQKAQHDAIFQGNDGSFGPKKYDTRDIEKSIQDATKIPKIPGSGELTDQQTQQVKTLAQFYQDAFDGRTDDIWKNFKRQGEEEIAYLLAKLTVLQLTQGGSILDNLGAAAKGGPSGGLFGSGGLGPILSLVGLGGGGGGLSIAGNTSAITSSLAASNASGFDSIFASLGAALPGFANGGSFTVGGNGGIDRNIMSINGKPVARVNQGEPVTIGNPVAGINPNVRVAPMVPVLQQTIHVDARGAVMNDQFASQILSRAANHATAVAGQAGQAAYGAAVRDAAVQAPGAVRRWQQREG